jgi:hypothetical protein
MKTVSVDVVAAVGHDAGKVSGSFSPVISSGPNLRRQCIEWLRANKDCVVQRTGRMSLGMERK